MDLFSNDKVNLDLLRKRAYNYRWAVHDRQVIPLTAADPDFPVAAPIVEAIQQFAADGYFSYGAPKGDPAFCEAFAHWYYRKKHANIDPGMVLPVNSAANGLYIVAAALLNSSGGHVIIPDPVDFLFRKSVEKAGGMVKTCPLNKTTGNFDHDKLQELMDENTRAIFLCNPNNPLGTIPSREELTRLILLAEKNNTWLVADEIWSDICYESQCISLLDTDLPDYQKLLVVSGLSKNFALAGLRIGYIISKNQDTANLIYQYSGHAATYQGISILSQVAGTSALTNCDEWLEAFLIHLKSMRQLTNNFVTTIPFFEPVQTAATYLSFPRLVNTQLSSERVVEAILKMAKVALVPGGTHWFENASEGHVRICFATSEKILTEAFERMAAASDNILEIISK